MLGDDRPWLPRFVLNDMLEFIDGPQYSAILEEMTIEPKLDQMNVQSTVPVTLVWTAGNEMFDEEYQSHWKTLLPEASVKQLDNCHHSPQYDCVEQVVELILP